MPSVHEAVQGAVLQTYCTCFDKAGHGEEEVESSDGCGVPWDLVISCTIKECQHCLVAAMFVDTARISFRSLLLYDNSA
jgi:hypothetical protein